MELQINGRNMELTERLDEYVRRKVSKLDRYLPTIASARMDLSYENTRSAGDSQVAQLTIRGERGVILRSEERTGDMFASIDAVMDKMYRQIARYKGKRKRSRRGAPVEELQVLSEQELEEEEEREIVRVKRFRVAPMLQEEAIEQMELLGHDFFVFYNADQGGINVLYRRKDENYGLLIPDLG
jgi:putative sigma-54 modulation protein